MRSYIMTPNQFLTQRSKRYKHKSSHCHTFSISVAFSKFHQLIVWKSKQLLKKQMKNFIVQNAPEFSGLKRPEIWVEILPDSLRMFPILLYPSRNSLNPHYLILLQYFDITIVIFIYMSNVCNINVSQKFSLRKLQLTHWCN